VLTDSATIQKLTFRSDLPRLKAEGFYLFAQLEPHEQTLPEPHRIQLLGAALAALVAQEESRSDRPLPPVLPRAYRRHELGADWVELVYACDLAEPFERRNRQGDVLGVSQHLRGRVRLFRGAFAYFSPDDLRPLESVDTTDFSELGSTAENARGSK